MGELKSDLLQAIYDAAWERYEESIRNGNPTPVGSSEVLTDMVNKGYSITEPEVKEGFRILERSGIVGLGSGGVFGKHCKSLFIEDFFQ